MATYLRLLQSGSKAFVDAYYAAHESAAENAEKEYKAAVTLQRFAFAFLTSLIAKLVERCYYSSQSPKMASNRHDNSAGISWLAWTEALPAPGLLLLSKHVI